MNTVLATTPETDHIAQSISDYATRPTTDANQKTFAEYEKSVLPAVVRIKFQILATQYCEYMRASSQGDRTK